MNTETQLTMRQVLGTAHYDECLAQAKLQIVDGRSLADICDSREDLLAFNGAILKAVEEQRNNFRVMFQERKGMEDGDPARMDWIEEDLRRCLSIFRFARAEGITVRQAIDWLAGNPGDAELPAEFIAAFGEANKEPK